MLACTFSHKSLLFTAKKTAIRQTRMRDFDNALNSYANMAANPSWSVKLMALYVSLPVKPVQSSRVPRPQPFVVSTSRAKYETTPRSLRLFRSLPQTAPVMHDALAVLACRHRYDEGVVSAYYYFAHSARIAVYPTTAMMVLSEAAAGRSIF